jgi:hypothetical protein
MNPRLALGLAAFLVCAVIIVFALTGLVPADKEQLALIVVGQVLAWPGYVLAYYFGSSASSQEKTALLAPKAGADAPLRPSPPLPSPTFPKE